MRVLCSGIRGIRVQGLKVSGLKVFTVQGGGGGITV